MTAPNHARLFCDCDMDAPERLAFAGGTAAVASVRRPGSEGANEDGAALVHFDAASGILAVADGVGGQPAGERAAEMTLCALRDAVIEAAGAGEPLRAGILNGFERANRRLLEAGNGAATTLVVAEIREGALRPYHTGDSEILVTGQRGRRKLQIVSHSPVGYAVEAGLLDEREALHHDERHVISNAVGSADMRIEMGSSIRLAPRDTVLLASDGLFDNLHVDEIVEQVRAGPLAPAVGRLVEACGRRMATPRSGEPSKPDDLTVVAFRPTPYST